ncbi:MAG: DUF4430 domain-containing protein [Clostridia bacterium]|nr:DUF4430 domain-containing protein [Clostridia bacterium]
MNTRKSNTAFVRFSALLLAVLIAAMALAGCDKVEAQTGAKTITVDIVMPDGTTDTVTIRTDAAYLRGALEQEKLVEGEESQYGLFVKTVNGYTVDDSRQEWWCFTKGGETLFTGVDDTPIADGDKFEITLTVGY